MSQKTEIQNSATETNAKLGVVINLIIKINILWDLTPCRLVVTAVDGGVGFCHLLCIIKKPVNINQFTWNFP
jgi:hypothetical protein